jgi:hypothetical protein
MVIDYTEQFGGAVLVHGKGNNVLILRKLENKMKRFDGKVASYELEHCWLSCDCKNEKDQAWACVRGNDYTYWQGKELPFLKKGFPENKSMFDFFMLF